MPGGLAVFLAAIEKRLVFFDDAPLVIVRLPAADDDGSARYADRGGERSLVHADVAIKTAAVIAGDLRERDRPCG